MVPILLNLDFLLESRHMGSDRDCSRHPTGYFEPEVRICETRSWGGSLEFSSPRSPFGANFRISDHPRKTRLLIQYLSELIAISEELGEVLTQ